jgi:DNA polymerase-3 subunit delta'
MNLNAANACLKLLEDTPKDSFLFLITSKPGVIIDTIKSRCAKIRDISTSSLISTNDRYIDYIVNYYNPDSRVALIEEFANKDRESWRDFAYTTIYLINKQVKRSLNIEINCTASEELILEKLKVDSPSNLLKKYSCLKIKINETISYDLDLRVSTIELMEELYRN